jgi:hypothetical protein
MGMLDATATMMMQQKIADAYEDANVIWDQNNANRAECDSSPDDVSHFLLFRSRFVSEIGLSLGFMVRTKRSR